MQPRWFWLVLGALLLLVALAELVQVLDRATLTYSLPGPPGSRVPNTHTVLWGPGLAASVVAGLAVLVVVGWLGVTLLRRTPAGFRGAGLSGLVAVTAVLVATVITTVVGGMSVPAF